MLINTSQKRRAGFTLVEVMVAAGLCVLIMAVMATAFQAGLDSLSQLRSIASLQQQLRSAEDVIKRDLRYEHLESPFGNRVSDQRMDLWQPPIPPLPVVTGLNQFPVSTGSTAQAWHPPVRGFFRIVQEGENYQLPVSANGVAAGTNVNTPSQLEGFDNDKILSSRAVNHILHYAIKMPSDRPDRANQSRVPLRTLQDPNYNLLTNNGTALEDQTLLLQAGNVTAANANSAVNLPTRWAEVCLFVDSSKPVGQTPTGVPYYTLYRRVRGLMETTPGAAAIWQNPTLATPVVFQSGALAAGVPAFPGLSVAPQPGQGKPVNSASTITNPSNRLGALQGARSLSLTPPSPFNAAPWFPFTDTLDFIQPAVDNTGTATGEDILLTNVISFEVKVNWDSNLTPGGIQCGLGTQPPGLQGRLANSNTFTNPESIFDDLPLPSTMAANVPGFPGQDGNPYFARINPSAPTAFPYLDPTGGFGANNTIALPNFSLSTAGVTPGNRRVFDTWSRIEPSFPVPVQNSQAVVARWNANPGPLSTLPAQTQQSMLQAFNAISANPPTSAGIARQPYVDIVQGQPTNPTLLNLGRWDERFVPFDAQGQGTTAIPYGSPSPTAPTVLAPNPNFVPLAIRLKAIQIKIRVWDPKNNVARQITIVENL